MGANVKNDDPLCTCTLDTENNTLTLRGRIILDYTPIHIIATINTDTFEGKGHVEVVQDWRDR